MTPLASRVVRVVLIAIFLAFVVAVTLTMKRRQASAPPPPSAPSTQAGGVLPSPVPEMTQLEFTDVDKGRVNFKMFAEKSEGKEDETVRMTRVRMEFTYKRGQEQGHLTITSEHCDYTKAIQKAVFRGSVVVLGDDKLDLRTESLVYRGDKQFAKSDEPVSFKRNALSGTAVGMDYFMEENRLELHSDVSLKLEAPGQPAMLITAGKATLDQGGGKMHFAQGVVLRQPSQTLTSERLVADLSSEQAITHAEAEGGIVLDASVSAAGDAPVDPAAGGTRHLEAKRLVMEFAQGRMKSAMAGPDATMTVQPGPKETREVRRVQGRFLAFTFDGEGRLTELQAQKDAGFRLEPIPPAKGEVRQLTTQNFTAKVDPLSGELRNVEFGRNAEFVQGTRKATAQQGNWNAERQVLELRRNPQVTDGDGSLLDAQVIDMNVATGDITAEGRVRHDVKPRPAANAQAPFSGASGGFANSKSFVYDAKTKTARYSGDAKLQSGTDIVSAQTIVLGETPEGRRTLTADTGVQASLVPRQGASPAPGAKPPEKLVASSDKMRYDEAKRELVFEGQAKLQQGVLVTESPTANAALDDTGGVRQLVAGEPVKVTQDKRTATGTKATYTPAQDTMVITGDKVVLDDPGQQKVEGRSITFHMKSDRIVVDGQERRRTEMRLKGAPIPGVGTGGKAPTVPGAKAPAPGGAKPPAAAPAPKASAAPPARP